MNVQERLKKINPKIEFHYSEESRRVSFEHPEYYSEFEFFLGEDLPIGLKEIEDFFSFNYEMGKFIEKQDYFEIVINPINIHSIKKFYELKIPASGYTSLNIYYEISEVSDIFTKYLDGSIPSDRLNLDLNLTKSLKIYGANVLLNIKHNTDKAHAAYNDLINIIFFEFAYRYNLKLETIDYNDKEKFGEVYIEEARDINNLKTVLDPDRYDSDLLAYYVRANLMDDSEFKYIAFFQVLECIFDEVYIYETAKDAQSIIEANWFDTENFDNIKKLIDIIDKYNKEKNDRNKTKLVLEKYFKGELHDEAFLLANREIIEILKNLNKMKNETELKDLQKLSNVIYDFRCDCTHSNRKFPKSKNNNTSKDDIKRRCCIKNIRIRCENKILYCKHYK